jgi:hypothetical protein
MYIYVYICTHLFRYTYTYIYLPLDHKIYETLWNRHKQIYLHYIDKYIYIHTYICTHLFRYTYSYTYPWIIKFGINLWKRYTQIYLHHIHKYIFICKNLFKYTYTYPWIIKFGITLWNRQPLNHKFFEEVLFSPVQRALYIIEYIYLNVLYVYLSYTFMQICAHICMSVYITLNHKFLEEVLFHPCKELYIS